MKKLGLLFLFLLTVLWATGEVVSKLKVIPSITYERVHELFENTGIKVEARDDGYETIDGDWFRNKGAPFVAKFFKENNLFYVIDAMDCEDLADIFIAVLKAKYIADHQKEGKFTRKHGGLLIGNVIWINKKKTARHNTVVMSIDYNWQIIEPLEFLRAIQINPINHSVAFKTFSEVMKDNTIEKVCF